MSRNNMNESAIAGPKDRKAVLKLINTGQQIHVLLLSECLKMLHKVPQVCVCVC